MVFGLILVAIGVIALLVKFDILTGSIWGYVWPVVLVIIGLSFFFGRFFRWRRWWWGGWSRPWDNRDRPMKE